MGRLADEASSTGDIAQATPTAEEEVLESVDRDPWISHCLWVLTRVTTAARSESFVESLALLGVKVSGEESASELLARISNAVSSKLPR